MGLVFGIIAIAIGIRLCAGSLDRARIAEYLRARGASLRSASWAPFGKGWFGESEDRIYSVEYADQEGSIHRVTVKTSLFGGVYMTEDRITPRASLPSTEAQALREENARLRAELERRDHAGS